jgi:hypothetical protein
MSGRPIETHVALVSRPVSVPSLVLGLVGREVGCPGGVHAGVDASAAKIGLVRDLGSGPQRYDRDYHPANPLYTRIMNEQPKPPRFRVILELSFRDTNPWSPTEYDTLLERMTQVLRDSPECGCTDVFLRESMTIPADQDACEADYEDWRNQRGEYDMSPHGNLGVMCLRLVPGGGPISAVDWRELRRLWNLDPGTLTEAAVSLYKRVGRDPEAFAVFVRVYLLKILQDKGLVAKQQHQDEMDRLFQKAAAVPIERWPHVDFAVLGQQMER